MSSSTDVCYTLDLKRSPFSDNVHLYILFRISFRLFRKIEKMTCSFNVVQCGTYSSSWPLMSARHSIIILYFDCVLILPVVNQSCYLLITLTKFILFLHTLYFSFSYYFFFWFRFIFLWERRKFKSELSNYWGFSNYIIHILKRKGNEYLIS